MKRHNVIMLAALAMLLVTASMPLRAQWYVGGRVSFSQYNDAIIRYGQDVDVSVQKIYNTIKISPEVGYTFNSHWSLGMSANFHRTVYKFVQYMTDNVEKRTICTLNPYVRFSFFNHDRLSLFVDATASLDVLDTYYWSAGICPGVSYALTDHFLAVAKAGFFGYKSDNDPYKWEANLDMTKMNLSLFYLFGKKEK